MKFNNRPNQCVWISRAVAVLGIPFFQHKERVYVPLGQRSKLCPDEVGKFGLPGGYLDWDESASEALIREVWEELGLNLLALGEPSAGSLEQPYYVFSDPTRNPKQNVSLRFHFTYLVDELPALTGSDESENVQWVLVEDAMSMDLAFNHAGILKELYV